jgi:multisubunit Na+/H+ antiporter MnhE subunit
MRKTVALVAEIVFWWAAALGVWSLTLSSVDPADLIVATPLAFMCGVMAATARRALAAKWHYPHRASAWLARLPLAIAIDTVAILALPWRKLIGRLPDEGRLVRIPVAAGAEVQPTSRRAAAAFLLSATPGTYVLHADDDTGELLVHELSRRSGSSMIEVVRR